MSQLSQLSLDLGPPPDGRQQPAEGGEQAGAAAEYPAGWSPGELPEPAATAVREEPALSWIAARTTVHRLHSVGGTTTRRGRRAGIAYLEQRAQREQWAAARVAMARRISLAKEPAESEE